MPWDKELVDIVQVLMGQDCDNPTISRNSIERTVVVAAMQVSNEMTFSQTFSANIATMSITPDPTDSVGGTRDESFINLATLKAACIMNRGQAIDAARKAVLVKDGNVRGVTVDLRSVFGAKLELIKQGWCSVYDDAKFEYESGQVRVAGAAVMTPFRLFSDGHALGGYLGIDNRSRDTGFI